MLTVLLLLGSLLFAASVQAEETVPVDAWLTTAPIPIQKPLFADSVTSPDDYLGPDSLSLPTLEPREGLSVDWLPGRTFTWTRQTGSNLQWIVLAKGPHTVYSASYVISSQWQELPFTAHATVPMAIYLDGKAVVKSSTIPNGDSELSGTMTLHRGKHLLLIKAAGDADSSAHWSLTFRFKPDSNKAGSLSFSTDARRAPTNFADATLFDNVTSPTLSPDGKRLACVYSHRDAQDFAKESWIEIFDARTGKPAHTIRPLKGVDNVAFFPHSQRLIFTASDKDDVTLWAYTMHSGRLEPLLKGLSGVNRLVCSPDEKFLYYTIDAEKPKNEKDYERWAALEDRMSDWTSQRQLYVANLQTGDRHELSELGEFAFDDFALSREGDQILFTRRLTRIGRPYYTTEFWITSLKTGKSECVLTQLLPFETKAASFTWLPGGKSVAYVTASFTTDPADTLHNLTQCSLWMLDLVSRQARNLSRDQKFSVLESEGRSAVVYNESERNLWFQALIGGRVVLMRVDPLTQHPSFKEVNTSLPYTDEFSLANSGACAFTASNPTTPQAFYTLTSGKAKLILNPAVDVLPRTDLATYTPWNFVNSSGDTIEGWLIAPTDYRPEMSRTWPMIVYYYGGVSPRDLRFTFTYDWWAANGYFVYVLNPSGCIGYGQAFADKHSNDWGTVASQDIIEGTRKLLKDKPFIDAKRVGAYGGSYGGFITEDLATKADQFAALVSDAGISNISTYFGGGDWGFTYGDIALPGSFPWNRPDIFAGKSPVFHADKIHTPPLLIHGTDDENVPPMNSDEMFTALKLLGRDVAYVRFAGEDHSIATKYSNLVTYREIMLEWFDKYLKRQPGGWDARWKK